MVGALTYPHLEDNNMKPTLTRVITLAAVATAAISASAAENELVIYADHTGPYN